MDITPPSSSTILLVDDEPEILFSMQLMLRRAGFQHVLTLADSREVTGVLETEPVGAIILDLQMPYLSGKELLEKLQESWPNLPVLVATAANDLQTAVDCMKAGAFDYFVKPIEPGRVISSLNKALEINLLRREISALKDSVLTGQVQNAEAFADFRTSSLKMTAVFSYLEAIAPSPQPVLITGETGVGKELAAQALHKLSTRRGAFVAVNSAGLDDQMFSDTLFGHKKGAYTGANEAREGMLARAAEGTLFLDEIGDLTPASQIKLLRLLQEGEYHPLGSDVPVRSRARIVVATHQNLPRLIEENRFRRDLYYRLMTHTVSIPPLRERPEDLPVLLDAFFTEAAAELQKNKPTCPPELLNYLTGYEFPGNVRELKALVYDAVARHRGGVLATTVFRNVIGQREGSPAPGMEAPGNDPLLLPGRFPTLQETEEWLTAEALRRSEGNQGAAAGLLGISRQALNKRLRRK